MAIQTGDKVPACTLKVMGANGPEDITTEAIFAGKKVELSFLAIVPMNRTTFYKSNRGYFFTLLLSRLYLHPRRNVIKTASSKNF